MIEETLLDAQLHTIYAKASTCYRSAFKYQQLLLVISSCLLSRVGTIFMPKLDILVITLKSRWGALVEGVQPQSLRIEIHLAYRIRTSYTIAPFSDQYEISLDGILHEKVMIWKQTKGTIFAALFRNIKQTSHGLPPDLFSSANIPNDADHGVDPRQLDITRWRYWLTS